MDLTDIKMDVENQYVKIIKQRKFLPQYYSYDLHIHTPASKCYCKKINQTDEEAYKEIVDSFISSELNVIAITDHNVCSGYYKIKEIFEKIPKSDRINKMILPGVEITCMGIHFLALFDADIKQNKFESFLIECGLEQSDNSEESSADMVSPLLLCDLIEKFTGILLIPHSDAENGLLQNIISKKNDVINILKGKSIIRVLNHSACLGVFYNSDYNIDKLTGYLKKINCDHLKLLKASDSHSSVPYDEYISIKVSGSAMGSKVTWIKSANTSFESMVTALKSKTMDYTTSAPVNINKPVILGQALFGSYIQNNPTSKNTWSSIVFSEDLNCIIGSRGAGKSTVLEYLQAFFQSKGIYPLSEEKLAIENNEFNQALINKHTPKINYDIGKRRILDRFKKSILYMSEKGNDYAFYIEPNNNGNHICKIFYFSNTKAILCNKHYLLKNSCDNLLLNSETLINSASNIHYISQKEIEDIAKNPGKLKTLIISYCDKSTNGQYSVLSQKIENIKGACEGIARKIHSGIVKNIEDKEDIGRLENQCRNYIQVAEEMKKIVFDTVKAINSNAENEGIVRVIINCSYNKNVIEPMIESWLEGYSYNTHSLLKELQKKNEKEKLFAYFQYATNPEDMIPYMLFMNKAAELAELTGAEVAICQTLCDHCRQQIKDKEVMLIPEVYLSYEFNIKVGISSNPEYRRRELLSYGQCAICILNIIINTTTELKDYRPLMIDQPEDDLDNLYIYSTMVKQFQSLKKKRQLIIATHNPNILIGSETEQIIVLKSNGDTTKVDISGCIENARVREHVVAILEGDSEALNMRIQKYGYKSLNKNNN